MSKFTSTILLALSALFFVIGTMSVYHSKTYDELTNVETIEGTIFRLHCPTKGAAALSLSDNDFTYNLTVKFAQEFCDNDNAPILLGQPASIKAVKVDQNYYQAYQLTVKGDLIVAPTDVEADQSSATFGLFFLAFILVALVIIKGRRKSG